MKVAVRLSSDPFETDIARAAFLYVKALLVSGHGVFLFFDKSGVFNALNSLHPASNEPNLPKEWNRLKADHQDQLTIKVCSAAAQRRGVINQALSAQHQLPVTLIDQAEYGSLTTWHQWTEEMDRHVSF